MKRNTLRLINAVNIFLMTFCLLALPNELEGIWGENAKIIVWAVVLAAEVPLVLALESCARKAECRESS